MRRRVRRLLVACGLAAVLVGATAGVALADGSYVGDSPKSTVCVQSPCNVFMTVGWHDLVNVSNGNRNVAVSGNCRASTGAQQGPANSRYIKVSQRFVVRGFGLTGASLSIPGGWTGTVTDTLIEGVIPESGNSNQQSFQQNYANITITGDADSHLNKYEHWCTARASYNGTAEGTAVAYASLNF